MSNPVIGTVGVVVWAFYLLMPMVILFVLWRAWTRVTQFMDRVELELVMLNRQIGEMNVDQADPDL
jgi:uncharacterized lipoprotein